MIPARDGRLDYPETERRYGLPYAKNDGWTFWRIPKRWVEAPVGERTQGSILTSF